MTFTWAGETNELSAAGAGQSDTRVPLVNTFCFPVAGNKQVGRRDTDRSTRDFLFSFTLVRWVNVTELRRRACEPFGWRKETTLVNRSTPPCFPCQSLLRSMPGFLLSSLHFYYGTSAAILVVLRPLGCVFYFLFANSGTLD